MNTLAIVQEKDLGKILVGSDNCNIFLSLINITFETWLAEFLLY